MKETLLYGAGMLVFVIVILLIYKVAFAMLDNEPQIIEPEPGIRCVVVTHGFMSSVDCWESDRVHD